MFRLLCNLLLDNRLLRKLRSKARYPRASVRSTTLLPADPAAVRLGDGVGIGSHSILKATAAAPIVLGRGAHIGDHCKIDGPLLLGDGASIQDRSYMTGPIEIGRACVLAPNLTVSAYVHNFRLQPELYIHVQDTLANRPAARPVVIEDDVWVGANVAIMPGIRIGKGAIVGANAVVIRDVAPYTVVGGVPAKPIATRLEFQPPSVLDAGEMAHLPYFYSGFASGTLTSDGVRTLDPVATVAMALGTATRVEITGVVDRGGAAKLGVRGGTGPVAVGPGTFAVELALPLIAESRDRFDLTLDPPTAFLLYRLKVL